MLDFMKPEKKNQIQYKYSSFPVEMQFGNPSSKARVTEDFSTFLLAKRSKLAKSSLVLKTMISDFFLSSGAFLNQNPINNPAKNNKRILIAAVFHFVDPV